MDGIGSLNESPLHAALKIWYAQQGDAFEVPLDGFVADVQRQDGFLVEIQTGSFSQIKRKLATLLPDYALRLVYPVVREKWLVKLGDNGERLGTPRKSPKTGEVEDAFAELTCIAPLLSHPNFYFDVVLIEEDELRHFVGRGRRRKKGWAVVERRLRQVLDCVSFDCDADWRAWLPNSLPETFTTAELATEIQVSQTTAQQIAYCYFHAGFLARCGKRGRAYLYQQVVTEP